MTTNQNTNWWRKLTGRRWFSVSGIVLAIMYIALVTPLLFGRKSDSWAWAFFSLYTLPVYLIGRLFGISVEMDNYLQVGVYMLVCTALVYALGALLERGFVDILRMFYP